MIAEYGLRNAGYRHTGTDVSSVTRCSNLAPLLSIMACLLFCLPLVAAASAWSPEAVLTAYVKDHYPWSEIEVTDLHLSSRQPVEQPAAITVEKNPPGRSVFRFDFPGGKSITATAQIKAYDRVLMSRGGFRKGYVLTRNDVYSTLMETARIPKGAMSDEDLAVGRPLLRSVVSDMPITDAQVSDKPHLKRGHKVVLVVESAGFSIKAMGELKQDAVTGEYVQVVSQMSRKIVSGLLLDENTVRVEF
jgi:flagella basal body P-ring formation protein FlgA